MSSPRSTTDPFAARLPMDLPVPPEITYGEVQFWYYSHRIAVPSETDARTEEQKLQDLLDSMAENLGQLESGGALLEGKTVNTEGARCGWPADS